MKSIRMCHCRTIMLHELREVPSTTNPPISSVIATNTMKITKDRNSATMSRPSES
jgi:hypothetical protein